jgi:hypothetical protein
MHYVVKWVTQAYTHEVVDVVDERSLSKIDPDCLAWLLDADCWVKLAASNIVERRAWSLVSPRLADSVTSMKHTYLDSVLREKSIIFFEINTAPNHVAYVVQGAIVSSYVLSRKTSTIITMIAPGLRLPTYWS